MDGKRKSISAKTAVDVLNAEKCKKGEGNRTVRVNQELTKMHQEVIQNLESIQGRCLE